MKNIPALLLIILLNVTLNSEVISHVVKSGETLYSIASYYETLTDRILEENNLTSNSLKIDQILFITKNEADKYTVIKGDTLSQIALTQDITLKHLLLVNRIDENYKLRTGEILTIPTDSELKKSYKVQSGDTLSWISMTYNIEVQKLIEINNLKNNSLKVGDVLELTSPTVPTSILKSAMTLGVPEDSLPEKDVIKESYTVKSGDTLSGIAYSFQTSILDLKKANNFISNSIRTGTKIRLPDYAKKREPLDYNIYHQVVTGDTLSGISMEYDISETLLRDINNLKGDNISIGQRIKLIPQESRKHKVLKGESLWSIASSYNISVDQLMQYNHLNSTLVKAGKILNLYDYSVVSHTTPFKKKNYNLVSLKYHHNTTASQPYKNYAVDELINPFDKYNTAKDNWRKFSELIDNEEPISKDLTGWVVIIDPGHGGKDPGAIATVSLNGVKKYIVEDEYAYDTAVRLYELLKRNGAEVHMTILSPDHISRNPKSNSTTFINEKNEVYNDYNLNKLNNSTIWPVGGQWGLNQRVLITNRMLSTSNNKKSIFISLHADNDVDRGIGKLVLYRKNINGTIDDDSKKFAKALSDEFGEKSSVGGMPLAVLSGNKANYKVLIELRNMAHLSEAMLLLDSSKRQNDALMILNGIKNYIKHE